MPGRESRRRALSRVLLRGGVVGAGRGPGGGFGPEPVDGAEDGPGEIVDGGDVERGDKRPADDGVERGGAEFVEESHGAVPEKLVHPGQAKADPGGARNRLAEMYAGKDGGHLRGPEHLIKELDNGLVEPEEEGDEEAEEGGGADDREERTAAADGEGEGDFLRGDALRKLGDDWITKAALPESAGGAGGGGRRCCG